MSTNKTRIMRDAAKQRRHGAETGLNLRNRSVTTSTAIQNSNLSEDRKK